MGHVTDTLYESCSVRWRGRDTGLLTQTYIAQKKTKQNKKGERWIVVTRKLNVVPFNSPFFLRWKLGTGVVDMLDCIWPEKRDEAPFWGRLLLLWIHNCQTWLLCDVTRPWRGSLTMHACNKVNTCDVTWSKYVRIYILTSHSWWLSSERWTVEQ